MEVRKQQISIVKFAEMINCKRNNVYDIFKRSNIDIIQLKLISKALNRNFFKELADDMDIINELVETEKAKINRKAVAQFLEVVPDIMKRMGKPSTIVFPPTNDDGSTPDFVMPDFDITFTVGETFRERFGTNRYVSINNVIGDNGIMVEIITTIFTDKRYINIPIKYYSESEWERILNFVFKAKIISNGKQQLN